MKEKQTNDIHWNKEKHANDITPIARRDGKTTSGDEKRRRDEKTRG